ncbi:hypothetical protein H1P_560024 [Hyella patelloides LEGE 07179]|uniref:Uncharacterized protein n=1 Tax=Hyella patelloides LEGE 07179 TaxID=945734 RepID=A0A563W0L9_9CYAN|nr:hypothetical protein H1P_560024 [Hyella patelloides LEGE 07179]
MLLTDNSICVYLRLSVDGFLDLFVGVLSLFYITQSRKDAKGLRIGCKI